MKPTVFIKPPKHIPLFIRFATWAAERITNKEMQITRILAWYPKAAFASGVLEANIVHKDKQVPSRLLQLVRIQVSFLIGCSFCIDMNTNGKEKNKITADEIYAMQNQAALADVKTFSKREIVALEYTRILTKTPVTFEEKDRVSLKKYFCEREIVILCTTVAQVNYWSRMLKGFDVPVACPIKK